MSRNCGLICIFSIAILAIVFHNILQSLRKENFDYTIPKPIPPTKPNPAMNAGGGLVTIK